jgi:hypothetical protein
VAASPACEASGFTGAFVPRAWSKLASFGTTTAAAINTTCEEQDWLDTNPTKAYACFSLVGAEDAILGAKPYTEPEQTNTSTTASITWKNTYERNYYVSFSVHLAAEGGQPIGDATAQISIYETANPSNSTLLRELRNI